MDKLLPDERKVYDAVLSAINVARNELIEPIMDPDSVRNVVTAKKEPDANVEDVEDSAESEQPTNDTGKSDIAKSNISEEYLVVRILKDLSTFQAVDNRKYTLQEHDIVSLPAVNANGLVKRNIAQLI